MTGYKHFIGNMQRHLEFMAQSHTEGEHYFAARSWERARYNWRMAQYMKRLGYL